MEVLSLENNYLIRVDPQLSRLNHVRCLALAENELSSLDPSLLNHWSHTLVELDISANRVACLRGFEMLHSLQMLDVSHNLLANVRELFALKVC